MPNFPQCQNSCLTCTGQAEAPVKDHLFGRDFIEHFAPEILTQTIGPKSVVLKGLRAQFHAARATNTFDRQFAKLAGVGILIIDGVDGNTSAFAIESEEEEEEEEVVIECNITLVNPRYMRMNTRWTFDDFLAAGSAYAVSGSGPLHINGNVDMSSYAGKGTLDLDFKGGPVESLYMEYKESDTMGSITRFKANDSEARYLDLGPIGRRMEKAFAHVMEE